MAPARAQVQVNTLGQVQHRDRVLGSSRLDWQGSGRYATRDHSASFQKIQAKGHGQALGG